MNNILLIVLIVAAYPNVAISESLESLLDVIENRNKKNRAELRVSPRGDKPRKHIIDPYLVARKENRKIYTSRCNVKDFKKFFDYEVCSKQSWSDFNRDFPNRSTDAYGKKFYSKLSKKEGKAKRDELIKQLDWVSFNPMNDTKYIELTVPHLRREIAYIERYVMKINPRSYQTR